MISRILCLVILVILGSFPDVSTLQVPPKAIAEVPPSEGAKLLVDDLIRDLKNNDTSRAQIHLNILNQQLPTFVNSTSLQSVKVLLDDVSSALNSGDVNKALVHLNLIKHQLSNPPSNVVQAFSEAYARLIDESRTLTQNYQNEIGKWKLKQYSNGTMISITDNYVPKFQSLVDRAKSLQDSEKYRQARDFTIKSFQSEIESYKHFRNLLATGNSTEDSKATQLLSDALRYEDLAFAAFNSTK
jgi:hypothetical protein